jgi:hypothetical protein
MLNLWNGCNGNDNFTSYVTNLCVQHESEWNDVSLLNCAWNCDDVSIERVHTAWCFPWHVWLSKKQKTNIHAPFNRIIKCTSVNDKLWNPVTIRSNKSPWIQMTMIVNSISFFQFQYINFSIYFITCSTLNLKNGMFYWKCSSSYHIT